MERTLHEHRSHHKTMILVDLVFSGYLEKYMVSSEYLPWSVTNVLEFSRPIFCSIMFHILSHFRQLQIICSLKGKTLTFQYRKEWKNVKLWAPQPHSLYFNFPINFPRISSPKSCIKLWLTLLSWNISRDSSFSLYYDNLLQMYSYSHLSLALITWTERTRCKIPILKDRIYWKRQECKQLCILQDKIEIMSNKNIIN